MSAATTVILKLVYLTGLVGCYTTADGETPQYIVLFVSRVYRIAELHCRDHF